MPTITTPSKIDPGEKAKLSVRRDPVAGSNMMVGITSFGSWMLGVGTMIGSMAWLIYEPMLVRAGSLPTVCAWVLGAVITIPLAFVLAELASMYPSAGGPYVYKYMALKRRFPHNGELLGFTTGWLYWVALIAGVACMCNGFAALLSSSFWQAGSAPAWFGSVAIAGLLLLSTLVNLRNIKEISRLNSFFTGLKVFLAAAFVALVMQSNKANLNNIVSYAASTHSSFSEQVMSVLVLCVTAFAGIELVGCSSSETENATRSVPRSILLTLVSVALIFIVISLSICSLIDPVQLANGSALTRPFQATCPSIARYLAGPIWGQIFNAGVLGSIITCTINALLALARISYSMAETKLFPARFARLNSKHAIPADALWFQFWSILVVSIAANITATIFAGFDPYTFLGEVFGFLYSFLAMLFGFCLVSLRYTDPEKHRPFRIGKAGNGLAWLTSAVTIVVYAFIAFGCAKLIHQLAAVCLLLCGLPIYFFYRRSSLKADLPQEI